MKPVDAIFTRGLPKVELHAHLSGSISRECLHQMWLQRKAVESTLSLIDPLVAIPLGKVDYDVRTFFPLFSSYIYRLCDNAERLNYSTTAVLNDFKNDGVVYLELRTTPRAISSSGITKDDYVSIILDCIKDFGRDTMSTFLILSVDRRNSEAEAMEVVDLAIKYQPRGVIALDLCGDPSHGDISIYREAFKKAKLHGLKLTLHFAEVPSSSTEQELKTLLSYQPERIGHAIHLPEAVERDIITRQICLELCISCNVHAKLTVGGFSDHHFGYWRNKSCPLVLCTDDVGIFCSSLSNEYLIASKHFNLSRNDILKMCKVAINSIFGGESEVAKLEKSLSEFAAASPHLGASDVIAG